MSSRARRLKCSAAGIWFALLSPVNANAEVIRAQPLDTRVDGVYGRMDGDLTVSLAGLVEFSPGGPAPGARLAAHYFWMAGAYAAFSRALNSDTATDRVLSMGVDLRPAFLPRWSFGLETGPDWFDLTVDSIALSVGAYWAEPPEATFGQERGLELGLGFGLPLFAHARGLWIEARGQARIPDGSARGQTETRWGGQLGLAWHTDWLSPITTSSKVRVESHRD
jgi:hypothetical protein